MDDCAGTLDEIRIDLAPAPTAPGVARRAASAALCEWRLSALADAVVLTVSELVTNAVRYGRPPLRMVLTHRPHEVRVEVHDDAGAEPGPGRRGDPYAESGRGLEIVRAVSSTSGVAQVPGDGKVVYAAFDLPPAAP